MRHPRATLLSNDKPLIHSSIWLTRRMSCSVNKIIATSHDDNEIEKKKTKIEPMK